ncbi:PREDICTED: cathepsin L1-like [Priapulus caudatus]|uniref:Cathepsin L1-like n=1 Tax=Priapulus caudatus TaxID=37621 RepID=A0ABM1E3P1_PRICU|nr:PREDICTED: cathepsin L1-like [Priapulus caudatus]
MLLRAVVLCCVVVFMVGSPINSEFDSEWKEWKAAYNKEYEGESEEAVRRIVWEANMKKVMRHNLAHSLGKHSYRLGMNHLADLTAEEFVYKLNGYKAGQNKRKGLRFLEPSSVNLPPTVDWRDKGYVTDIKDQKSCGSCWAFSATGAMEGQHFRATRKLVSLSEQNLVDCSQAEGNLGCNGGLMDSAFQYVTDAGGIDTEDSYPYEGVDDSCKFDPKNVGATVKSFTDIDSCNETALQVAVATVGPISVAIDASASSFHLYESGVYDEPGCSSIYLDHGVLAVGYGTLDDKDYWLVKNSWGADWGDNGYIYMSRNKDNQCGIATNASYPNV